jgi:hypothetical protein
MCWKCDELDRVIEHYRGLATRITDQGTLTGIATLIEKMEAQKLALHCEEQQAPDGK